MSHRHKRARVRQKSAKPRSCHLCDKGFPLVGDNHVPTQSLGMIPVLRCSKRIERSDIARFRAHLNISEATTRYRNGLYRQLKRPYGDYLYAQDREKFMADLREWLPKESEADSVRKP